MTTTIYILKCQSGKYYVGKSDNPTKRFQEHLSGKGSAWTRKYKPIAIEATYPNSSDFDEDKYTKEYMSKYGFQNVRGGTYVTVDLDEFQMEALKRELWGAKNCCTQCGREGHFVKSCYAKTDVFGEPIEYESSSEEESSSDEEIIGCTACNKEFTSEYLFNKHTCSPKSKSGNICYRCGRTGHWADGCYAKRHINGKVLDD